MLARASGKMEKKNEKVTFPNQLKNDRIQSTNLSSPMLHKKPASKVSVHMLAFEKNLADLRWD